MTFEANNTVKASIKEFNFFNRNQLTKLFSSLNFTKAKGYKDIKNRLLL